MSGVSLIYLFSTCSQLTGPVTASAGMLRVVTADSLMAVEANRDGVVQGRGAGGVDVGNLDAGTTRLPAQAAVTRTPQQRLDYILGLEILFTSWHENSPSQAEQSL